MDTVPCSLVLWLALFFCWLSTCWYNPCRESLQTHVTTLSFYACITFYWDSFTLCITAHAQLKYVHCLQQCTNFFAQLMWIVLMNMIYILKMKTMNVNVVQSVNETLVQISFLFSLRPVTMKLPNRLCSVIQKLLCCFCLGKKLPYGLMFSNLFVVFCIFWLWANCLLFVCIFFF